MSPPRADFQPEDDHILPSRSIPQRNADASFSCLARHDVGSLHRQDDSVRYCTNANPHKLGTKQPTIQYTPKPNTYEEQYSYCVKSQPVPCGDPWQRCLAHPAAADASWPPSPLPSSAHYAPPTTTSPPQEPPAQSLTYPHPAALARGPRVSPGVIGGAAFPPLFPHKARHGSAHPFYWYPIIATTSDAPDAPFRCALVWLQGQM